MIPPGRDLRPDDNRRHYEAPQRKIGPLCPRCHWPYDTPNADIIHKRCTANRRTRVYVAGPMTGSGNPYANIYRGLDVAVTLLDRGYAPYVPHLTCILEMTQGQRSRETWLGLDKAFLLTCDALVRLDGVSPGADDEVRWATEAGIPVYYSLDQLVVSERATR